MKDNWVDSIVDTHFTECTSILKFQYLRNDDNEAL